MAPRKRRRRQPSAGFTLLEVMVTVLLAMIGLIGTVAVQQTVLNATTNAQDQAVAMRLAMQRLEVLQARVTRNNPILVDQLAALATGAWTAPVFLDALGNPSATQTPQNRFARRELISNPGVGLPYNISIEVQYNLDSGAPKAARLDVERRKTW